MNNKKNILIVIDSLGMGGAEQVVMTLTKELIALNHSVDMILINEIIELDIPKEVKVHILGFEKSFLDYQRFSKKLYNKIDSLEHDSKKEFDLILVNLQRSTRLMKQYKHKNLYHVIHNTLSETSLKNRKGLRYFLKKRTLQRIYNNLDLITVSKGVQKDLLEVVKISPKSIQQIYNPVNIDEMIEKSKEVSILDLNEYIIHVGRFEAQKNHERLLRVYANSNITIPLVLVGGGSLNNEIINIIDELGIKDKVVMVGKVKNPYPLISKAKALVLSSDYEGLGMVLIEALVLNTPVISTDCPSGPGEILGDDLSEYLVPTNNEELFSKRISEVVKQGYEIPENIIEKFDSKKVIENYLELINY